MSVGALELLEHGEVLHVQGRELQTVVAGCCSDDGIEVVDAVGGAIASEELSGALHMPRA